MIKIQKKTEEYLLYPLGKTLQYNSYDEFRCFAYRDIPSLPDGYYFDIARMAIVGRATQTQPMTKHKISLLFNGGEINKWEFELEVLECDCIIPSGIRISPKQFEEMAQQMYHDSQDKGFVNYQEWDKLPELIRNLWHSRVRMVIDYLIASQNPNKFQASLGQYDSKQNTQGDFS